MSVAAGSGRFSDWFTGLVLGLASGLSILVAGFIGVVVAVAALVLIAWKGPRALALTGLVTGIGLVWTALFGRVWLTCDVLPQPPGTDCEAGDISRWVAVAAGILIAGLIASWFAFRRTRR